MAKSSCKQLTKLFGQLRDRGLEADLARSGHWKIFDSEGRFLLSCSASAKNPDHQVKKIVSDLRKYHGITV